MTVAVEERDEIEPFSDGIEIADLLIAAVALVDRIEEDQAAASSGGIRCKTASIVRDGWDGLNRLTSGAAVLPDAAVDVFGFSGGQAAFDAKVEITLTP